MIFGSFFNVIRVASKNLHQKRGQRRSLLVDIYNCKWNYLHASSVHQEKYE